MGKARFKPDLYKPGTDILEAVDGALDKTFTHDDDGNIYTALTQKTSASPAITADYLYTSDGLRLRKTASGTTVVYHYDLAFILDNSYPDPTFFERNG